MASRRAIEDGIIQFIRFDVEQCITDIAPKAIAGTFAMMLDRNRNMFDKVFDNSAVSALLKHDNDDYDVDAVADSLAHELREHGNMEITIPKIPLLMRDDAVIMIGPDDIIRLRSYIR